MDDTRSTDWFIGLLGAVAALIVAGVLSGIDGQRGSTISALAVVVVVVLAGTIGSRRGGGAAALVGALAYNFFHTRPFHTLRIDGTDDLVEVVMILAIGIAVGEIAARGHRLARTAGLRRDELSDVHALGEALTAPIDPQGTDDGTARAVQAVDATCASVGRVLGASATRYEDGAVSSVAGRGRLTHRATLDGIPMVALLGGWDLGDLDLEIEVRHHDDTYGHLVVTPRPGHPVTLDDRLAAIAMVDQLALALAAERSRR